MNAKITSNINLAKKLKKLGSRQETVLDGVADHLTEDEKTNINLVLSKMEQLSNKIEVEEDKLPNQHTSQKTNFEALFVSFKHELRVYEESDKKDCSMFSTVDYFRFKVDLYHSFNPKYYQSYITDLIIFENQSNRVLLFLASDRGFIYSKMRDCLQKKITWKEYIIGQKLSYTTVNNHIQFHELVVEFPRVLISGASKTEWFKFMKQFKGVIQYDDSLKTRLATSLKEFVEEDSLFEDVDESLKI